MGLHWAHQEQGRMTAWHLCLQLVLSPLLLEPAITLDFRKTSHGEQPTPNEGGHPCGQGFTLEATVHQAFLVSSHYSKDGFGLMFRN